MTNKKQQDEEQQKREAYIQSLASLCLAEGLAEMDTDKERKEKKKKVVALKEAAVKKAFDKYISCDGATKLNLLQEQRASVSGDNAKALLIDLSFSNPFSPYELKYNENDLLSAAERVGTHLGLPANAIHAIWKTRKEALKSHSEVSWGKIVMFALGGGVILAAGGWALAPVLGGYLGAAGTGLAGAAAIAHGLALIGGGSLALGGMGMAGGLWLVVGIGAGAGTLAAGGGALLIQLGSNAAKVELIKLQVSFKEISLSGQVDREISKVTIQKLDSDRKELQNKLKEEQSLNDKNSARISEIENILETLDKSINWMEKERSAA